MSDFQKLTLKRYGRNFYCATAARYYGVPQSNISKCLKGERKSAGVDPDTGEKLFWKFVK